VPTHGTKALIPGNLVSFVYAAALGRDPADAAEPEILEAESAAIDLLESQPGDEEAGEHEEHVHAHVAAGHADPGMKCDHHENREGAEPVDIGAIRAVTARMVGGGGRTWRGGRCDQGDVASSAIGQSVPIRRVGL
jgi:hypothetical protein